MGKVRRGRVTTHTSEIAFFITVTWPACDVDAAYDEIGLMHSDGHNVQSGRTPTMRSVDRFLIAVAEDRLIREQGIKEKCIESLMMGCCSIEFTIDPERVAELPALMEFAKARMRVLRKQYVRYYKTGTHIKRRAVHAVSGI